MLSIAQTASAQERILDIKDTGQGFWHVEDHSLPIITISFAFEGAGSVNDPQGKEGLVQLLSNTLDEGAGDRDATAFQKALQDHAIELSFSSTRDNITGKIKTLKRHAPLAFELLHDALTAPRFDDDAVDRMREANIMRIRSSVAKTEWQASRLMNHVLFGDHPYADNSGGTISGLQAVTPEDLRAYHEQFLTRSRLKIGTAGDMTTEEMAQVVERVFGELPEGIDKTEDRNAVNFPLSPVKAAYPSDSPQSSVMMAWPAFAKTDPDYHAYRVLNYLLGGGGFASFLMDEVREKQGLTYGIYSQPVFKDAANYIFIESAASPENIAAMKQAVQNILADLKARPVDAAKLDDAKSYLIGSLPLRFSSTMSLSSSALRLQLEDQAITALDEWDDKISAITAEDIQRVANRIFESSEPVATVIAGAVPDDMGYTIFDSLPGVE